MSKSFNCLFVSYAKCDKDCTSWVDLIPMSELEAAISSEDKKLTIKILSLSSCKYVKAECIVFGYQETTSDSSTYTCRLVFSATEHNIKEDIEQGTLDIVWTFADFAKSPNDIWDIKPSAVYYKEANSKDVLEPNFSFLEHAENDAYYFNFVNYKGQINRRSEIFYYEEHERAKEVFKQEVYDRLLGYVKREVDKLKEFSLATRWPDPWPSELTPIYEVLGDETKSAYFLSALIQKSVMESKYEWTVCKVRLPGRERRSLYFYRTEVLKDS